MGAGESAFAQIMYLPPPSSSKLSFQGTLPKALQKVSSSSVPYSPVHIYEAICVILEDKRPETDMHTHF